MFEHPAMTEMTARERQRDLLREAQAHQRSSALAAPGLLARLRTVLGRRHRAVPLPTDPVPVPARPAGVSR